MVETSTFMMSPLRRISSLLRCSVTHYIVDACANALGKTLIIEWSRNGPVTGSKIINHAIDLFGGHPFTDIFGYVIQQGGVDFGAFAYTFQLFRCTEYFSGRKF